MSTKAGEYLGHEPIKLRFTTTHPSSGQANTVLKRSLNQTTSDIMAPSYVDPTTVILYEKLDVSVVLLETRRRLTVIWTGRHNKEEAEFSFLLPKTTMVYNLVDYIAEEVTLTPTGSGKIRVFEASKDRKKQME